MALDADPSWTVHRIACGHDVAIDRPLELAALLEAAAGDAGHPGRPAFGA
jgi:hypothetical protein